jgi:hypothetical protein
MINMQLSASEAKEADCGCAPTSDNSGPKYPWGLAIYLDDDALAKLGITTLPDVGTRMQLTAWVDVTSNSQRQNQDGKTVTMDLQITDMDLTGGGPPAASVLYGD